MLKRILAHPLTRDLDIDDPRTTEVRRSIVRTKPFLRRIYAEWYGILASRLPPGPGLLVEIGSGGGFMRDFVPALVTTDVFPCEGIDLVVDARRLPFEDSSVRGILMTNVLHHVPEPTRFLGEAARCVRPGGSLLMVEPWNTPWSRTVYRHLHHEPFDPSGGWSFPESGPLSGANGALPWILFSRDAAEFSVRHPQWRIATARPLMPLAYLASGGVSMRSFLPGWCYGGFRRLESLLPSDLAGMFAFIELVRTDIAWER